MVDKRICTKVNDIGTFAFKYVFSSNDLVNQSILKWSRLKRAYPFIRFNFFWFGQDLLHIKPSISRVAICKCRKNTLC